MPWDDEVDSNSGGLLLDYTGKVTEAYFIDGNYGVQLTVDVTLDHPEDHPRIADGVIHNWFGVGNGWRVIDGGAAVEAVAMGDKEAPTKFNGNTAAGRLVKQLQSIDPDGKTLANGTTKQAAYWKGLGHAHWGAVNTPKREQRDGAWVDVPGGKDVSMPVELLGAAGTNGKAPAEFDIATLAATPEQLTILQNAAVASKNVGEFQAAIIQPLAGQPVLGAVMKQPGDVYASLLVS